MGLLLTARGSALHGRMRLSGVEEAAEGACTAGRCTLYLPTRGGVQPRLELELTEGGTQLRVDATSSAPMAERRAYVLVRAPGR